MIVFVKVNIRVKNFIINERFTCKKKIKDGLLLSIPKIKKLGGKMYFMLHLIFEICIMT